MTGFTELLDVRKRLRQVSVEGCELIGQGGKGEVFRLDAETPKAFGTHARDGAGHELRLGDIVETGMKNYFAYQLRQMIDRKELVSIYADPQHPDEFLAGYPERVDSQHYLICEFTPWGEVDAFRVRRLQDVLGILYGEEYEERIRLMLQLNQRKVRRFLPRDCVCEDGVLQTVFRVSRDRQEIISLIISQEIYTGRVVEYNGLYVVMELFDFFGEKDSQVRFSLQEIEIVQLRSGEERMFYTLEQYHKQKSGKEPDINPHEDNDPDNIS